MLNCICYEAFTSQKHFLQFLTTSRAAFSPDSNLKLEFLKHLFMCLTNARFVKFQAILFIFCNCKSIFKAISAEICILLFSINSNIKTMMIFTIVRAGKAKSQSKKRYMKLANCVCSLCYDESQPKKRSINSLQLWKLKTLIRRERRIITEES